MSCSTAHTFCKAAGAALCLILLLMGGCASRSVPQPESEPRHATRQKASPKAAAVIRTARVLLGAPYKWGGTSPKTGFDCSGFVWFVYHQNGINLPRISWQQFGVGEAVGFEDIRPGDLLFHKVDKGAKSLHVGIVTDRGTFIHAPSSGKRVMESLLSNEYWRTHFIGARRLL
ncbi:glycoside hydrolase [Pseudodesulfovibrio cashew]|uniref:Glycoside hydrolase n=1 Tax=Pseudodesulfovibrio cashew TaxID=2678688 RepID=A0A6I6JEX1_9BACT|nr:NlpC/P60 family protein [Pseudodesulfovibrio cashew]QGY38962.1 glycoside hydrolase [Pseudodesulfovibrio cashew]